MSWCASYHNAAAMKRWCLPLCLLLLLAMGASAAPRRRPGPPRAHALVRRRPDDARRQPQGHGLPGPVPRRRGAAARRRPHVREPRVPRRSRAALRRFPRVQWHARLPAGGRRRGLRRVLAGEQPRLRRGRGRSPADPPVARPGRARGRPHAVPGRHARQPRVPLRRGPVRGRGSADLLPVGDAVPEHARRAAIASRWSTTGTPRPRTAFVARVREESARCDVVVVSYHAGVEYSTAPLPGLDAFLDRLAACGATVVHGHHPHVLQAPRFAYAGPLRRLVLPSIGNFISGQGEFLESQDGRGRGRPGHGRFRDRARAGAVRRGLGDRDRGRGGSRGRASRRPGRPGGRTPRAPGRCGRPAAWQAYYRGRLADLARLFSGVATSSGR